MTLAQRFIPYSFSSCSVISFCFVIQFTVQCFIASSCVTLHLIIPCCAYVNGADEMRKITSIDQQNKLGNKESSDWSNAGALSLE